MMSLTEILSSTYYLYNVNLKGLWHLCINSWRSTCDKTLTLDILTSPEVAESASKSASVSFELHFYVVTQQSHTCELADVQNFNVAMQIRGSCCEQEVCRDRGWRQIRNTMGTISRTLRSCLWFAPYPTWCMWLWCVTRKTQHKERSVKIQRPTNSQIHDPLYSSNCPPSPQKHCFASCILCFSHLLLLACWFLSEEMRNNDKLWYSSAGLALLHQCIIKQAMWQSFSCVCACTDVVFFGGGSRGHVPVLLLSKCKGQGKTLSYPLPESVENPAQLPHEAG